MRGLERFEADLAALRPRRVMGVRTMHWALPGEARSPCVVEAMFIGPDWARSRVYPAATPKEMAALAKAMRARIKAEHL